MSTYRELKQLESKWQKELKEVEQTGTVAEFERIVEFLQDLSVVSAGASWDDYPESMGT